MDKKLYSAIFIVLLILPLCGYAKSSFEYKVNGIEGKPLQNVQARLAILSKPAGRHPNEAQIKRFYAKAPKNIRLALQPYGYFHATIKSQLQQAGSTWRATFDVKIGPPLKISRVDIKITGPGAKEPAFTNYLANLPLQKGKVLQTSDYNAVKNMLYNIAERTGYLNSQMTQHHIAINLLSYTATVKIRFVTGKRYYYGKIHFNKTPFSERFLKKFLPMKPGQPYSSSDILKAQQNLSNSTYFSGVAIQPLRGQTQGSNIPININVTPRKKHQINLGLGYGTDTGVRGSVGWDWRHITSTGQHFNAIAQVSQIQSNVQATYYIPGINPINDQYSLGTGYSQQAPSVGGRSQTLNLTAGYHSKIGDWQRTLALSYQAERFKLPGQTAKEARVQRSNLLIPSMTLTRTKANNTIFTTNGNRFSTTVRGAAKPLISTVSFAQFEAHEKYIHSLYPGNRLILRGDYGFTTVSDLKKFPLSLRYFAGGASSIRGFDYEDLGPGRYLYVGSGEFQQRIYGKWYATTFIDAGNASDHFEFPIKSGAGGGVMYASPIGPLELTVAHTLNKGGKGVKVQFTMGPDL